MVKKLKSLSEKKSQSAGGLFDSALAGSVKESAQQIWLAGMGAFAKAQEAGSEVFDALVKEGAALQKKTTGLAEEKVSEVSGRMSAMAEAVTAKAGQNWDKLEAIFEQRTAKAMSKLGVPTAKDVQALEARIAALEAKGTRAAAAPRAAAKRAPVATKAPAKRGAAKKAPAKRAAAKKVAAAA